MILKLSSASDMCNSSTLKVSLAAGPAAKSPSTSRFPRIDAMDAVKAQKYLNMINETGKMRVGNSPRVPSQEYIAQLKQKAAPPVITPPPQQQTTPQTNPTDPQMSKQPNTTLTPEQQQLQQELTGMEGTVDVGQGTTNTPAPNLALTPEQQQLQQELTGMEGTVDVGQGTTNTPAPNLEQEEEQAIEKGLLNVPTPQTPAGQIDENTPLPRLQKYKQEITQIQQQNNQKIQEIDRQLAKVDTYIQRAQTPGATGKERVQMESPVGGGGGTDTNGDGVSGGTDTNGDGVADVPTKTPIMGNPAPAGGGSADTNGDGVADVPTKTPIIGNPTPEGGGAAGGIGNFIGRGLKAPGRALGRGVDWAKQKAQQFGQGFSAAEGEGPILTASMGASQSLFD